LTYIQNVSNTFSWKRLINFIPIYSSLKYVYAFFLIEVYILLFQQKNQNSEIEFQLHPAENVLE
jgi:hypothetical protein